MRNTLQLVDAIGAKSWICHFGCKNGVAKPNAVEPLLCLIAFSYRLKEAEKPVAVRMKKVNKSLQMDMKMVVESRRAFNLEKTDFSKSEYFRETSQDS